jgi:hypothetical protein
LTENQIYLVVIFFDRSQRKQNKPSFSVADHFAFPASVHPVPHPDQCAKKGIRSILHRLAPFLSEEIPRFLIARKARKTPFHEFSHQPL